MSNIKHAKLVLIDKAERDSIITELDRNIIVEAGAGSGKTTSLVDRITALICEDKTTLPKIAAVTFTKKAAAELKERCQLSIERAYRESDGERKERFARALMDMEQGFIGTIHSFCARLLRERPVEAGIDPGFTEIDEEENTLLMEETWEEYANRLHESDETAMERLYELGAELEDLKELYKKLSNYPEVEVVKKELPIPDFSGAVKEMKDFLAYALPRIPATVPDGGRDTSQESILQADALSKKLNMELPRDIFRVVAKLRKAEGVTQKKWPKGVGKEVKETVERFVDSVLDPAVRAWNEYRHFHLISLAEPAVRQFRELRQRQSKPNFNDLLMLSSRMLRDNPEVRKYFRERFTHLLVDEFQDTDPIQAEVMLYLTGEDRSEKDWAKLKPVPGSLFVVGDPKQSIYRFRRADIDIYNTVKDIINSSGGLSLNLRSNFRSVRSVCEWVNPVFQKSFVEGSRYQAPHTELIANTEDNKECLGGVRKIIIPKVDRNKNESIAEEDARLVSSWIRKCLDGKGIKVISGDKARNPKPADFLVLHTDTKMIHLYAKLLEDYAIPYEVSGGDAFVGATGLRELMKLLSSIAEPESSLYLVAALRGMFGISDDILYKFRKSGGRFFFYSEVPDAAESDVKAAINPAYEKMRLYRKWASSFQPSVAIEKIIDDIGLVAETLSGAAGGSATGAAMKALEYLQGLEASGVTEFNTAVESLEAYVGKGKVDAMDISHKSVDAVRIMNLHQAKGLEAPIIFLACPKKKSSHGVELHIARQDGRTPKGYFKISSGHSDLGIPPEWDHAAAEEENYSAAEKERLMYVASTRAKQLLIISHYPFAESVWSLFTPCLETTPLLEGIEVLSPVKSLADVIITPEDCRAAEARFEHSAAQANTSTYELVSATDLKDSARLPSWSKEGKGMAWGKVIHRSLEALGKGMVKEDLELFVEAALEDEGMGKALKKEVIDTITAISESILWKEVQLSEKSLFEVPFSCRISPRDSSGAEYAILSGVIDLVYKTRDGWVIVDYKTDDVGTTLDEFVTYYAPQVKTYCKYWEEITGEKVARAGLYFTKTGILVQAS